MSNSSIFRKHANTTLPRGVGASMKVKLKGRIASTVTNNRKNVEDFMTGKSANNNCGPSAVSLSGN